jgi:hypothetical protein
MRVDSRARLAASFVALAKRVRDQELSLASPLPPVLLAEVLAYWVRNAVRIGAGGNSRAVDKVTLVMHTVSQQCRQFSHKKVRLNICFINKLIVN